MLQKYIYYLWLRLLKIKIPQNTSVWLGTVSYLNFFSSHNYP